MFASNLLKQIIPPSSSRGIITRVPETKLGIHNAFSMYPPARQYFGHEVGMFVKQYKSKPLGQKYFNKPTIQYTPPPPTTTLIKYKPMPHDMKELPLSMRWFNGP
jgi:hypothetical protein